MKIIRKTANPSGAYPPIQEGASRVYEGCALWPEGLPDDVFYQYNGFVTLTIEDAEMVVGQREVEKEPEVEGGEPVLATEDIVELVPTVTGCTPNMEAWEGWQATLPQEPDPVDTARAGKEAELSAAAHEAIVAGMDVETSQGTEHFSLEETDQINLSTALAAVQGGAAGYPYHADGQLCRLFSAEEIGAIAQAATGHKLYHTTLCNHLLTWVRRVETVAEVEAITYSAEALPQDLAENMAAIFTAAAAL